MTDPDDVWGALSRDPRVPEHAAMRASDADREVVLGVLTEAYDARSIHRVLLLSRASKAIENLGCLFECG